MNLYQQIFDKLHSTYGNQNWWPVTGKGHVPEYSGGPKNEKHKFEIIIGAILTQNTAWKNVEKAIKHLNKNNLMSVDVIRKVKREKLGKLIRSAGYFNQKSERLKTIADYLHKNYNGSIKRLFDKPIEQLRQELLSIKGIGPETADSIILYSSRKPIFVIDAYTKRIFSRIGVCEETCRYDELQSKFHQNLEKDEKLFNEYHALLVELAKQNCRKTPICSTCPIRQNCNYYKTKFLKDDSKNTI